MGMHNYHTVGVLITPLMEIRKYRAKGLFIATIAYFKSLKRIPKNINRYVTKTYE